MPEPGPGAYLGGEDGGTRQSCFSTLRLFPNLVNRSADGLGNLTRLVVDFWTNLRCSILIWSPDKAPYMGKEEMVNDKTDEDEKNLQ